MALLRRFRMPGGGIGVLALVLLCFQAACATAVPDVPLRGRLAPVASVAAVSDASARFTGPLTVLTLNLAHGRGTAFNQIFQRGSTTRDNLSQIAEFLGARAADIVALQEADGPSRWSGGMDHVAMLAEGAGYAWYARATHVSHWLADYGTAMLSRRPFTAATGHTFAPSPPTTNKGFLAGTLNWQPNPPHGGVIRLDVLSVHLDFSRRSVRTRQIAEMAAYLAGRNHPVIILGDFNSDWFADDSVVKALSRQAGLDVYRPAATDLGTYGGGRRRLDWILISRELNFIGYAVMPERLSDHLAVVATIGMRKAGEE